MYYLNVVLGLQHLGLIYTSYGLIFMKILHTECSMNWGGQEYRTILESIWLNNNGHHSWVGCHPNSKIYQVGNDLEAKVVSFDFSKSHKILTTIKCYKFCKNNGIDVINTHGSRDSTVCFPLNHIGFPIIRSRHITSKIKKAFSYKYCCKKIIATADIIKRRMIDIGIPEPKISVIGEGVDLSEYSPDRDALKIRKEFSISSNSLLVTNIGMIRSDKGQKFFLEAAYILLKKGYPLIFLLVGEGTGNRKHEKKLLARVRELGIKDRFFMIGYRSDVADIISASDIIVIASTGVEAQSRIVPQAFASQKAVIATNVGGLPELVKNNINGLIVEPRNPLKLSENIEKLVKDTNLRKSLAKEGYKYAVEQLSFEQMMEKTLKIYKLVKT